MNISFYSIEDTEGKTLQALRDRLPDHHVWAWPDVGNPQELDYAICWGVPDSFFDKVTQLRAIFSLAAGVDHLLNHPQLPKGVPIIRLSDAGMADKIAEYVQYGVLRWHRHFDSYQRQQNRHIWQPQDEKNTADYRVGVMGLGIIGNRIASRLQDAGYAVCAWKRTRSTDSSIEVFYGNDQLPEFLQRLDTLVCVLPLTASTNGIINAELLKNLPSKATLINVGRGAHIVEEDLLHALETNHLAGAMLDVCSTEPLPATSPLWDQPNILITPHIAGPTQLELSVAQIADGIHHLASGGDVFSLGTAIVDDKTGY